MSTYYGCRWHPITDTTFHFSVALLRPFPVTLNLAVAEGFEPPVPFKGTTVFRTVAISRTRPHNRYTNKYTTPLEKNQERFNAFFHSCLIALDDLFIVSLKNSNTWSLVKFDEINVILSPNSMSIGSH